MKKSQNNSLRKIALIISAIILFPALFFTAHEINSLDKNEQMVEDIYKEQMETLLFALNQYVLSYFESSVQKIDALLTSTDKDELQNAFSKYFSENNPVTMVTVYSTNLIKKFSFSESESKRNIALFEEGLPQFLLNDKSRIEKLIKLKKQGYRKIENFSDSAFPTIENDFFILLYVYTNGEQEYLIALLVNRARTLSNIIEPKRKEIAGDRFNIGIYSKSGRYARFAEGDLPIGVLSISKELWVFPEYVLGIHFKGQSIADITASRFRQSLLLIILLDIFLFAGGWFIFRSTQKEIRLAQLKSDFVANVSHELRTPLSIIRMYAETLEMGRVDSDDKKRMYYKNISQESERLTHLINNILNFSRMESGKKKYLFETIDINSLVKDVFNIYKDHVNDNGFKYSVNYFAGGLSVNVDKTALSEALINLIDNAIKYSSEKKEISIKTGKEKHFVFIEVLDSGMGIKQENHKKIFEKFFREATGPVHNTKGSGLGLSLVKHIVEAHNGRIELKSSPGKGSAFKLLFLVKES